MASLLSSSVANNYAKNVRANGLGPRTLIVSIASSGTINDAELNAAINNITLAAGDGSGTDGGGPDAFVVAGLSAASGAAFESGTTDTVYLALQGTGTLSASAVKAAAEGAAGGGSGTFTVSTLAIFDQNYQ